MSCCYQKVDFYGSGRGQGRPCGFLRLVCGCVSFIIIINKLLLSTCSNIESIVLHHAKATALQNLSFIMAEKVVCIDCMYVLLV